MRKYFLLSFCLSVCYISFFQQKDDDTLSKLFDTHIIEMYKQRFDSLSKEVENLNNQLLSKSVRMNLINNELRRANIHTSTAVRIFYLLNKIATKQITKQDSSFYVNPHSINNIDTTGPIIIEYYDGVQQYLPPWDSLLKAFPYVDYIKATK